MTADEDPFLASLTRALRQMRRSYSPARLREARRCFQCHESLTDAAAEMFCSAVCRSAWLDR